MARCRFCELKFHYKKDCREWKEISKKGMRAARNAMIVNETEDSEEEGDEIASACIIEEVKAR